MKDALRRVFVGHGMLAKFNLGTVFVQPTDRSLLGMRWKHNPVVDAIQWERMYVILMVGSPNCNQCEQAWKVSMEWHRRLGVSVAPHKMEGRRHEWCFRKFSISHPTVAVNLG